MTERRTDGPEDPPSRVWILNHHASSPLNAGGIRHFAMARAVVKHGGQSTVFAAGFDHGRGDDGDAARWRLVHDQWIDGVRFTWVRTFSYEGNTIRRVLDMLSYSLMVALVEIGRPRPDVVIGSTVHPFAALAGWAIARHRRARFVYEVRDLWPQTMIDVGEMSERSLAARALYAIEAFLARRADVVLTVLPGMADYLASRGLPTSHVVYLPNGPDIPEFDAAAGDPSAAPPEIASVLADVGARRQAGQVVFVYAGSHGLVNRLRVVLEAAERLESSGAPSYVLFVGDGPDKSELERVAAERGLRSVRFVPSIPKRAIPHLLSAVDVGVLHYMRTPVHRYGISFNKVFDYLAARLPVLFACDAANDPVAASGAGITVPPDDADALADAMRRLIGIGPSERRRMGEAGRRWVEEHHDMARLSDRFLEVVGMVPADATAHSARTTRVAA